jgi:hypothetical protein
MPTTRPLRRWQVAAVVGGVIVLSVVPLIRGFVAGVPVYLADLVMLGLCLVFFRPSRLPRPQRALLGWGIVFVASTLPSGLVALLSYDHPVFTLYYYARRVLALAAFGTFLALFSGEARLRRVAAAALGIGVLLTGVWSVGQVLTRSTGVVGVVDHVYYDILDRATRETEVDRWAADWKTPRAIAGWWNSNTTGCALLLASTAVAAMAPGPWPLVVSAASWVGLLATASRQALIGAVLFFGVLLIGPGSPRTTAQPTRSRTMLLVACAAALALAVVVAGAQVSRVTGDSEGTFEDSFASRWNNYPPFWDALASSSPGTFLFGRGAESWAVLMRTGAAVDAGSFVSNTPLLILAENGFFTCALFLGFLAVVFLRARTAWQRASVVVIFWLLNCDNGLYLQPGAIALMSAALALAAAPPTEEATAWRQAPTLAVPRAS